MKKSVADLEKFKNMKAIKPESNFLYLTFNDSLVYVYKDCVDNTIGIILKGGHGIDLCLSEAPGKIYSLDEDGYSDGVGGEELVMSLAQKLDILLP